MRAGRWQAGRRVPGRKAYKINAVVQVQGAVIRLECAFGASGERIQAAGFCSLSISALRPERCWRPCFKFSTSLRGRRGSGGSAPSELKQTQQNTRPTTCPNSSPAKIELLCRIHAAENYHRSPRHPHYYFLLLLHLTWPRLLKPEQSRTQKEGSRAAATRLRRTRSRFPAAPLS